MPLPDIIEYISHREQCAVSSHSVWNLKLQPYSIHLCCVSDFTIPPFHKGVYKEFALHNLRHNDAGGRNYLKVRAAHSEQ